MEDTCPYCGTETLLEVCEECGDSYCEECLCPPDCGDDRLICPNCRAARIRANRLWCILHRHAHGVSVAHLLSPEMPSEDQAVETAGIDYEPDREESLEILEVDPKDVKQVGSTLKGAEQPCPTTDSSLSTGVIGAEIFCVPEPCHGSPQRPSVSNALKGKMA